jgi:hypothetical protein
MEWQITVQMMDTRFFRDGTDEITWDLPDAQYPTAESQLSRIALYCRRRYQQIFRRTPYSPWDCVQSVTAVSRHGQWYMPFFDHGLWTQGMVTYEDHVTRWYQLPYGSVIPDDPA